LRLPHQEYQVLTDAVVDLHVSPLNNGHHLYTFLISSAANVRVGAVKATGMLAPTLSFLGLFTVFFKQFKYLPKWQPYFE